MKFEDF